METIGLSGRGAHSSTAKRVVVYRFDRQSLEAIVNSGSYLSEECLELITVEGTLQTPPYSEIKALCFVSARGAADLFCEHNLFERRPKVPGLWVRFTFRDGDQLDGILSHSLLDWPPAGYLLTPPMSGAARQRVYVPRTALTGTELRGVVGKPGGRDRQKRAVAGDADQLNMFGR